MIGLIYSRESNFSFFKKLIAHRVKVLLTLLSLFCSLIVSAQGYFLEKSHYKYEQSHKILMELLHAADMPQKIDIRDFKIIKAEIKYDIASTSDSYIYLHEKAYNVCAQQGVDSLKALALVLGHELYHYSQKQRGGYACHSLTTDSIKLKAEIQADLYGTYYAKLAGYSPCEVAENLLHSLYKAFLLSDEKLTNYPPQTQRVALTTHICDSAEKLVNLFELANMLMVIQEYDKAAAIYDYLCAKFASREMFFNAAVARLVWVKDRYFDKTDNLPQLPILLETNSRLERHGELTNQDLNLFNVRMEQCQQLLNKVIGLDSIYIPAHLMTVYLQILIGKRTELSDRKKEANLIYENCLYLLSIIDTSKNKYKDYIFELRRSVLDIQNNKTIAAVPQNDKIINPSVTLRNTTYNHIKPYLNRQSFQPFLQVPLVFEKDSLELFISNDKKAFLWGDTHFLVVYPISQTKKINRTSSSSVFSFPQKYLLTFFENPSNGCLGVIEIIHEDKIQKEWLIGELTK